MNFAASIPIEKLNLQHPDYAANVGTWDDVELLYKDGAALKAAASRFLKKKPKELSAVYSARLARFTSRPVLGTALGWYQAAMFKNDPQVRVMKGDKVVEDEAYRRFLENCNAAGANFVDFGAEVFLSLLLYRKSFVLVDRKPQGVEYQNRAQQEKAGALDVHLVRYDPSQVINWDTDELGNLTWVLIKTTDCERIFPGEVRTFDRWYYFDGTLCAKYEAERKDGKPAEGMAALVDGYPRAHTLSAMGRVPVRAVAVPDGLWLGNRAYLSACTYLDLLNALDWAIFNGCLPTLWIKGDVKEDVTRSEVGWIQLTEEGEMGYLEPAGNTYELAKQNIAEWREELYRQVYLQAQGRSSSATASEQSGYSKEMDQAPSQDVLNGLGDALRSGLEGILCDVADARGETDLQFSITGLEFDGDDLETIERGEKLLAIRLGETVEREVKKDLAKVALKDKPQDVLDAAFAEIESMKTDEDKASEDLKAQVSGAFGGGP